MKNCARKIPFLIKKATNRSKTTACSVKLETLQTEMLGTVTKKQFYSKCYFKNIKIQYPRNMAQETEETGTKPVLGTQSQKCKKNKNGTDKMEFGTIGK